MKNNAESLGEYPDYQEHYIQPESYSERSRNALRNLLIVGCAAVMFGLYCGITKITKEVTKLTPYPLPESFWVATYQIVSVEGLVIGGAAGIVLSKFIWK